MRRLILCAAACVLAGCGVSGAPPVAQDAAASARPAYCKGIVPNADVGSHLLTGSASPDGRLAFEACYLNGESQRRLDGPGVLRLVDLERKTILREERLDLTLPGPSQREVAWTDRAVIFRIGDLRDEWPLP